MFCSDFEINAGKAEADGINAEANEAIEADADETGESNKANEAADEAKAD